MLGREIKLSNIINRKMKKSVVSLHEMKFIKLKIKYLVNSESIIILDIF